MMGRTTEMIPDVPCGNTVALVDGELPPEVTAFYVVLAREEGWRPLCLSPVPAPFAVEGAIFRLGDVAGQLRAHLDARLDRALRLLADDVACESYI